MATTTPEADLGVEATNGTGRKHSSATAIYVVGRVLRAILTIYVVATATFFLIRLMPGNPVQQYIDKLMATQHMPYEAAAAQASSLMSFNLDQPLIAQYGEYMWSLLQGDFGKSIISGQSVADQIAAYLPWTIFCVGTALIISFIFGTMIGTAMAYRRGGVFDHVMTFIGSFTHSIPNFLLATMIIVFFGVQMDVLPIADMRGSYSPGVEIGFNLEFFMDALYHAALPIWVYIFTTLGAWMLIMKSSTVETLGEDYVTVARARGLSDRVIQTQYVGRNAMLPLFTNFVLSLGFVVGGSILVEKVTKYQGVGYLLDDALQGRDYPVLQGILLIVTTAVVIANLAADLLYSVIDPRIRISGKED